MKVETIQQFYVKQFLQRNFYIDDLKLELIDRYTIKVIDGNDDIMEFWWDIEECKVNYKDI